MVVAFHFEVEHAGFGLGGLLQQLVVDQGDYLAAVSLQLGPDLLLVSPEDRQVLGTLGLLLLLDGVKDSPRGSTGADCVLVGDA